MGRLIARRSIERRAARVILWDIDQPGLAGAAIERFGRMVDEIAAQHAEDASGEKPRLEINSDEVLEAFSRSFLQA